MLKIGFKDFDARQIAGIEHSIIKIMLDKLNAAIISRKGQMLVEMRNLIRNALRRTDHYISMANYGGRLAREFGFLQGAEKDYVDPIVEYIAEAAQIGDPDFRVSQVDNSISGKLEFIVFDGDYTTLFSLPTATYLSVSQGKNATETPVPWLKWLLESGVDPVVLGWHIVNFRKPFSLSRSGFALMQKTAGGSWHVPTQYAGEPNDNWLTVALTNPQFINELAEMIERQLTNAF